MFIPGSLWFQAIGFGFYIRTYDNRTLRLRRNALLLYQVG